MREETHEDTEVPPARVVGDVETGVERVSDAVLAELAVSGTVEVVDVTTDGLGKGTGVLATCLAGRSGCGWDQQNMPDAQRWSGSEE